MDNKTKTERPVLHTAGDYVIRVCHYYDDYLKEDLLAYGIYNQKTAVREAEARRLPNAIIICDHLGNPSDLFKQEDLWPDTATVVAQ
jgi:hypothetical protein